MRDDTTPHHASASGAKQVHRPTHPPCTPQNRTENGEVGKLSTYDQEHRACNSSRTRPARSVHIEQNDVVDDEDVSEPDERAHDKSEAC
jgi:hypothetical protein